MPQVKKDLSAKRAAAARRRHELHPRPETTQIRVATSAVEAMRKRGVKDRPKFVADAIGRHLDRNYPPPN